MNITASMTDNQNPMTAHPIAPEPGLPLTGQARNLTASKSDHERTITVGSHITRKLRTGLPSNPAMWF